jgi:hypothetical protein
VIGDLGEEFVGSFQEMALITTCPENLRRFLRTDELR